MNTRRPFTAFAFALVAGCGGGSSPEPVAFQPLQNDMTRSFPAGTYAFRTQAEMAAAWDAAPQQFGEVRPLPVIDFSAKMVVGISLGVGIRCNVPMIKKVEREGGSYVVSYTTNEGTGVTTLACLHQWYLTDFVAVPAFAGTVLFDRLPP